MRFEDETLVVDRELSELDERVLQFVEVLESADVSYVIVSGYVAILAGRSRGTEDVDIIVEQLSDERAEAVVAALQDAGYWCINRGEEPVHALLEEGAAARFAEDGEVIPNFEVKFPSTPYDTETLDNAVTVRMGEAEIRIGPLELQIAYKLFMGAEKDFEDALHLYEVFGDELDATKLERYVDELSVHEEFDELTGA